MFDFSSEETKKRIYFFARALFLFSLVLSLSLTVLLFISSFKLQSLNMSSSKKLQALMAEIRENEDEEGFKAFATEVDLLARRAYFSTVTFKTLLSFAVLFFFLLAFLTHKYSKNVLGEVPFTFFPKKEDLSVNEEEKRVLHGSLLIFSFVFIAGVFLISAFVSFSPSFIKEKAKTRSLGKKNLKAIKEEWPSFRGPFGQGIAHVDKAPLHWNENAEENILWKKRIPLSGFNSPVIWNDTLFISGANEEKRVLYAFNAKSGELLWQRQVLLQENINVPRTTEDTGLAAPSLALDKDGVYVIFGTGELIAFDFKGDERWRYYFGEIENHYGHSSSLILFADTLFVQLDEGRSQNLFAFNTKNGILRYKIKRDSDISWASPVIFEFDNSFYIGLNAAPYVSVYNVSTQKQYLSIDCMSAEVGPSPAYDEGILYAVNEYAKLVAIDMAKKEIIWQAYEGLPEVSSPVAKDGILFMASSYGTVSAYDAKEGTLFYKEEFPQGFYSSPIYALKRFYIFDMEGRAYVIKAQKDFEIIATNEINEKF